jgi:hypothetical protein
VASVTANQQTAIKLLVLLKKQIAHSLALQNAQWLQELLRLQMLSQLLLEQAHAVQAKAKLSQLLLEQAHAVQAKAKLSQLLLVMEPVAPK